MKLVQVSRIAGTSDSRVSPRRVRIGVLGFLVRSLNCTVTSPASPAPAGPVGPVGPVGATETPPGVVPPVPVPLVPVLPSVLLVPLLPSVLLVVVLPSGYSVPVGSSEGTPATAATCPCVVAALALPAQASGSSTASAAMTPATPSTTTVDYKVFGGCNGTRMPTAAPQSGLRQAGPSGPERVENRMTMHYFPV